MKITDIRKSVTYYVETDSRYPNQFRTDSTGINWETLYGMSWEEQEPPEEIIREFMAFLEMKRIADETFL